MSRISLGNLHKELELRKNWLKDRIFKKKKEEIIVSRNGSDYLVKYTIREKRR